MSHSSIKMDSLVKSNPIIFDADAGTSNISELKRLKQLEVGGLILGPLVSDEVTNMLRSLTRKYEVVVDRKNIKLLYPLKGIGIDGVDRISDLTRYAREEMGLKLVGLRLIATKYSEWMKLLQLTLEDIDLIELDFSVPFLISEERRSFNRLLYEIVHDITSMSLKPVAVRLPFFIPELRDLVERLSALNIAFVAISSAYLHYKVSLTDERTTIRKALCKDSSINDLILSLIKPWTIRKDNIVLSIETLDEEFIIKSLSVGIKAFELGFSTFMLNMPSLIAATKTIKRVTTVETLEVPSKGPVVIVVSDKCDTCNGNYLCVKMCPENVIKINERGFPEQLRSCSGCNLCVSVCPENAIKLAFELEVKEL